MTHKPFNIKKAVLIQRFTQAVNVLLDMLHTTFNV
jgi:hypothetical protein